jgi:hypothetical protein
MQQPRDRPVLHDKHDSARIRQLRLHKLLVLLASLMNLGSFVSVAASYFLLLPSVLGFDALPFLELALLCPIEVDLVAFLLGFGVLFAG